jgi:hypothetical protein
MNLTPGKKKIAESLAPTLAAVKNAADALVAVAVIAVSALFLAIIAIVRTRRTS